MAIAIQGLLLINNQNISANSKNRNSGTRLPRNSKKRFMYKMCKFYYEQGIHKDTLYFCIEYQHQIILYIDSCFEEFYNSI